MKKQLMRLWPVCLLLALACNNQKKENKEEPAPDAAAAAALPYTVQVQEFVNPQMPGLHSYTHGVYKDKIIMFGGRINGLHDDYNFDQTYANKTIYVVDTRNWSDAATWKVYAMSDAAFAPAIRMQMRANNAQFFTNDSVLYVIGGLYGANVPTRLKDLNDPGKGIELLLTAKTSDGAAASGPRTLPIMSAITMPALINFVMTRRAMPLNSIRMVSDPQLAITGGEVEQIGSTVYLTFGWNFSATADDYSHKVKSFTFRDDGRTLSISKISVCPTCWDGEPDSSKTGKFRRRDGSISAMTDPKTGAEAIMYYAGVFKDGKTNFDSPVWITANAAAEQNFVMRSNVYTCQVVPVYSKSRQMAYATLLGGMKNARYNGGPIRQPVELTATNSPIITTGSLFDRIPFSNQLTTMAINSSYAMKQYLLPDSFPNIKVPIVLPADPDDSLSASTLPPGSVTYNGSESELHWMGGPWIMANGVVDYDAFIKANPGGGTVAYLHGGIQSAVENAFNTSPGHYTIASKRIFAVKIMPLK